MALEAPRILAGRYEVGELIGRGGMAEVHIGHDTRLGRTVAIKVLRSDLARDPSFQARFRREAQAAAALNHPAIVAVYDTGEDVFVDAQGDTHHVPFIVMEYVEGHTVRDILRDGHAVPIEEAVEIVVGVLSALEYSHHAGIVHRDIKPANVMLTPTGAVKVMDFGIARAVADSGATMTQTQAVIGTAQYLSPEQARGEQVDSRSDLYSTGCLLFELLTGRAPFVGDSSVSVVYQHVREAPPVPSDLASDVPEVLDRITLKALAKEREARYASAAEFRTDLESAVHGGTVTAPPAAAYGAAAAGLGAAAGVAAAAAAGPAGTQILAPPATPTAPTQAYTPGSGMPWEPTNPDGSHTEDFEEDEEPSRRWLLWLLIGIAVAAVAGIIWLLASQGDLEPEPVTVPVLTGMNQEEATAALAAVDLGIRPQTEPHDTIAEGLFTRSDPAAGEEMPEGETIVDVWFSTGPGELTVPDVEGRTQAEARQILTDAGLVVGLVDFDDAPGVEADIATRTEPAAGETVTSGATVNLFLASGNVQVPDLTGETEEDAKAQLDELELRYTIDTEETDEQPPGHVVSQNRVGLVPIDTPITLVIAEEPPPTEADVPSGLAGLTYDEAAERIENAGLRPRPEQVESDEQQPGRVVYTDPAGGTTVPIGSVVRVYVAVAPTPTPTPTPTSTEGTGDE